MTIRTSRLSLYVICFLLCGFIRVSVKAQNYILARPPLQQNPYIQLPLGSIRPSGWLREMLLTQKNGATGNLDTLYPLVMNGRNGWLGGDGDQWERGPYWIDGLLPLAYILGDKKLIDKAKPWVEWALKSQQPDGYFGPSKDYAPERGIQRDNSRDWWPKMVMLKVLQQYYTATQDKRVISLLTNYFRYQLRNLAEQPLGHWTFWATYRGGDNLQVIYWLYNITGDAFLLELGRIVHTQTFDYTKAFLESDMLSRMNSIHCVNLAQGLKEPAVYFQYSGEKKYLDAVEKGMNDIRKYNGMAHGLYGGDEALHGNNPTQGSELCSAVEMMFSLESILAISGKPAYADQLELVAFNALPTQIADDFMGRQYFQQANQVMISRHQRNFDQNHGGTDVCYGLLTGYPCCTSNMHQGWPKFTQNLWYATPDNGVAALVYSPSEASIKVANGVQLNIKEETNYPFSESIRFVLSFSGDTRSASFPFHLRIPQWCRKASVSINGAQFSEYKENQIAVIEREWKNGDIVELRLPMHVYKNTWYENSVSVSRGPLVYALKMEETVKKVINDKDPIEYGNAYEEVRSASPWNYALIYVPNNQMDAAFKVESKQGVAAYPWNLENAPVTIRAKAKGIPSWQLYNDMAGPVPFSITNGLETSGEEEIILIPYGCTTLRISQFPVVRR
jgi:hypothetical protein